MPELAMKAIICRPSRYNQFKDNFTFLQNKKIEIMINKKHFFNVKRTYQVTNSKRLKRHKAQKFTTIQTIHKKSKSHDRMSPDLHAALEQLVASDRAASRVHLMLAELSTSPIKMQRSHTSISLALKNTTPCEHIVGGSMCRVRFNFMLNTY